MCKNIYKYRDNFSLLHKIANNIASKSLLGYLIKVLCQINFLYNVGQALYFKKKKTSFNCIKYQLNNVNFNISVTYDRNLHCGTARG